MQLEILDELQQCFPYLSELRQHHIRFYASVPLRDKNGIALDSLCLLDKQPRQMQVEDRVLLKALAQDSRATLTHEHKKKDKQKQIEQVQPASSMSILDRGSK